MGWNSGPIWMGLISSGKAGRFEKNNFAEAGVPATLEPTKKVWNDPVNERSRIPSDTARFQ
jgi:hypothetical protein